MCIPEGSAVPSDNRKIPFQDSTAPSVDCASGTHTGDQVILSGDSDSPSIDHIVLSGNKAPVMKTTRSTTSRPTPSNNSADPSANRAAPVEDSLQSTCSTNSRDDLIL